MRVGPFSDAISLFASPTLAGETGGMDFTLSVQTPPVPAFGNGDLAMIQIISTPKESYSWTPTPILQWSDNGKPGLDGKTFYPFVTHQVNGPSAMGFTRDSPSLGLALLDGSDPFYQGAVMNGFTDYLMYTPPGSSQAVPLANFVWSVSGNVTIPSTGQWKDFASQHNNSNYAGSVTPGPSIVSPFTASNVFPMRTKFDLAADPYN